VAVRRVPHKWQNKLSALAGRLLRAMSRHPFLTCCVIGFLAGSLLDLDHIPKWLFHVNYPVPIYIGGPYPLRQGRNLHGLALVGGGLMCAFAGGSLLFMVLEGLADKVKARILSSRLFSRTVFKDRIQIEDKYQK
jgi:hypothetical protein